MQTPSTVTLPAELQKLFPFSRYSLTIDGHRMEYVDEGHGPVVLLLHGNPTWSFYYRGLIEALRGSYRVIAPDFIGLGLSDHPVDVHFRASDRIIHVERLLEHLAISSFHLVMHDWGGSIGTGVAVRHPEMVTKLVYLNTTLTETETLPFIIKRAAKPLTGKFLTKTTKHFLKLTTEWGVVRKLSDEVKRGYLYPYPTAATRTAIWDFVADIPFDSDHPSYGDMLFLADNIPKLASIPTLIVWGLQDPCFHREMLSQIARHFPRAEVVEIPHGSHLVLEDAPEIAIPEISRFLAATTESAGAPAVLGKDILRERNPLYYGFLKQVQDQPRHDAVIEPLFFLDDVHYRHTTFQDLGLLVNKFQRGLAHLGLVAGDRVVMLVKPGVDFLALTYAIMGRGAIPVFLDPGMGRKKLVACMQEIQPQAFIGSPKAHLLRVFHSEVFKRIKFALVATRINLFQKRDLSFLQRFSAGALPITPMSDIGLIAFTSGATGIPKGVVYTPEMLESQMLLFKDVFGLQAGKRDLPLLPVFSIFSLASGMGTVFPPMDPAKPLALEPRKIIRIIKDLTIESSFGSPTLWNKIAEYCARTRTSLDSLKKVFMAGAPVSAEVLARVQEVLPTGTAFTPYGATEALPVTLIDAEQIKSHAAAVAKGGEVGTLVGRAVPGVSLKVIKIVDGPIDIMTHDLEVAPYEIGEVIVSGRNVSPYYFARTEATRGAKIGSQINGDPRGVWHRMGDVGYLDDSGALFFCGRKVHRVVKDGRTWYSIPVERIFNVHAQVKRSALVALGGTGEPAIVLEPYPHFFPETKEQIELFKEQIRALIKDNPLTNGINEIFFHRSFPVDARHNAKIYRDQLGSWATSMRSRGLSA
jgi:acyl-CoA synthetase (AMP-forming)/AMP-acid ligase II/pimeloyl-ACP methyl ester carboxylesterase